MGGRVIELTNGETFDALLKDVRAARVLAALSRPVRLRRAQTPYEMRPPGVVAFYKSDSASCMNAYRALEFERTIGRRTGRLGARGRAGEFVCPQRRRCLRASDCSP